MDTLPPDWPMAAPDVSVTCAAVMSGALTATTVLVTDFSKPAPTSVSSWSGVHFLIPPTSVSCSAWVST